MKPIVVAGLAVGSLFFGGCCRCGAQDRTLPPFLKTFDATAKALLPQLKDYQKQTNYSFILKDQKGQKIGILYLDSRLPQHRTIGYAGPIDTAILVNNDQKIVGVLVGNNQETPGFLNRVKKQMLSQWQGLSLDTAATARVDAVTGATLSSRAIQSNVKAIAAQATGKKVSRPATDLSATERQNLIKRAQNLHAGLKFINRYFKQWETREDDELALRFIMATEGYEKGLEAANAKNVKIFKRGKRGFKDQNILKLGEAYQKAPTAANQKALEAAILADFNDLKLKMYEHRTELRKSLLAVGKELAKNSARPRGTINFHSPAARAQEAKILTLASQYKKAPSVELEQQLRLELAKQLDMGIAVMAKAIERKEKELQNLKFHYQRIGANKAAAINARMKKLINK